MNTSIQKISYVLGKFIIVGVFLYFGIEGIFHPETYAMLVPSWVGGTIDPIFLVLVHGVVETICALFILFGLGGRWSFYILLASFAGVLMSVSGQTLIRDTGILGGVLLLLAYSYTNNPSI